MIGYRISLVPNINTMPYIEECGILFNHNLLFLSQERITLPDSEKGPALSFVSLTTFSKSRKVCFRFLSTLIIFSHSELTHSQLLFGVSQSFLSCVFMQSAARELQDDFFQFLGLVIPSFH